MERATHVFKAHGNEYVLSESKDLFGCTGVTLKENGVYRGINDIADKSDFERLENNIKRDKDYTDDPEIWWC